MDDKQELGLAKMFLKEQGFEHEIGFAFATEEMNPDDNQEIFFPGKTMEEALKGLSRKADWWVFEPSNGEQMFEDIWDAIEYAEEMQDADFEAYKEKHA